MKKVGIITFNRAINYGAILQTYALNKFLNNNKFDCETIDYCCDYIKNEYSLISFKNKSLKKNINAMLNFKNNLQRKNKFNAFIKNNIKLSSATYNKENISLANNVYNSFITGSDQVWNIELCNDENYYLPFVKNNKKISYAASFGNVEIIKKYSKLIENNLKSYDLVTVREKSAVTELKKYYDIDSKNVLDPTFLLDASDWNKILQPTTLNEKYIIMYVLHEESAYGVAEQISTSTKLPVYIITQSRKKRIKGKYIRNAGPIDFLNLIKNSEYVVTDSFHGTALSIIFRKNLKVVLKKSNIFLNDRLTSVLKLFDLERCIVSNDSNITLLTENTDYSKSEKMIKNNIKESQKILLASLNS